LCPNIFPRENAANELIQEVPEELRQLLREAWQGHHKQFWKRWPHVPYHYGQGRILGYELWRGSLSEQDQKQEDAAAYIRYEAYYDAVAQFF
jgi:hypothetical protein